MQQPLRVKIIPYIWASLPTLCIFIAVIVQEAFRGQIALTAMVLFYCCIHSTRRIYSGALLALGFAVDILTGAPFALHALLFVCFRWFVGLGLRNIEQIGFLGQWLLFIFYLPGYLLAENMLYSYYASVTLPFSTLPLIWFITLLFYPAAHAFMRWLEKTLIRRYWFVLKHA